MVGKWLVKYKNSPKMPIRQTDNTDTNQVKREPARVVSLQEEARKRGRPFPYPLPETCGIGEVDPLDLRRLPDGSWINDPGWWKR
jgi:hypothetical protein